MIAALLLAATGLCAAQAAPAFTSVPQLGMTLTSLWVDEKSRVAAALALGRVGNWRAAGYLERALLDSSADVRLAAAYALGITPAPRAAEALRKALARDEDWRVRQAAALALAHFTGPENLAALSSSARRDPNTDVRVQAARALAQGGSRDAARELSGPLTDAEPAVRKAAAAGLGRIGGLESLGILTRALDAEKDAPVRVAIQDAATRILMAPGR